MARETIQIVVAWAEDTGLEPTGRMVRTDGVNYFPEFKVATEGKAAMWLGKATEADIAKAEAYAAEDGLGVYVYPSTEKDPLGKAKAAAVVDRKFRAR